MIFSQKIMRAGIDAFIAAPAWCLCAHQIVNHYDFLRFLYEFPYEVVASIATACRVIGLMAHVAGGKGEK